MHLLLNDLSTVADPASINLSTTRACPAVGRALDVNQTGGLLRVNDRNRSNALLIPDPIPGALNVKAPAVFIKVRNCATGDSIVPTLRTCKHQTSIDQIDRRRWFNANHATHAPPLLLNDHKL